MEITSDVYCRNKLVSHRNESVKWSYKLAFHAFMCLSITENYSVLAYQSDRLIPPVLLLKLENNVVYHLSFLPKLNESSSPHQCIALPYSQ